MRIASPTFYALGESRVPAMVSGGAIAVNVVASVALVRAIGFRGLALGTSLGGDRQRRARSYGCCAGGSAGLDGRRLAMTFVKVVRGVGRDGGRRRSRFSARWRRVLAGLGPPCRRSFGWARRLAAGWWRWRFTAKLLRVDEFGDAVAIISGRVRKLLKR